MNHIKNITNPVLPPLYTYLYYISVFQSCNVLILKSSNTHTTKHSKPFTHNLKQTPAVNTFQFERAMPSFYAVTSFHEHQILDLSFENQDSYYISIFQNKIKIKNEKILNYL